jgi:hypothetical protein
MSMKKYIVSLLIISIFVISPAAAQASVIDNLQVQINQLSAQVASLRAALSALAAASYGSVSTEQISSPKIAVPSPSIAVPSQTVSPIPVVPVVQVPISVPTAPVVPSAEISSPVLSVPSVFPQIYSIGADGTIYKFDGKNWIITPGSAAKQNSPQSLPVSTQNPSLIPASSSADKLSVPANNSATPSAAAVPSQTFIKNFGFGSAGDSVYSLQKFLNIPNPTGYFGPTTKKYLCAYQIAHNLIAGTDPDCGANVGPSTRRLINQLPLPSSEGI